MEVAVYTVLSSLYVYTQTQYYVHTHTHTLQSLTHSSTDIRVVGCDVCASLESLPDPLLSSILPLLLQNTKEKNTAVRSSAEKAITVVVQGDAHLKVIFIVEFFLRLQFYIYCLFCSIAWSCWTPPIHGGWRRLM